MYSPKVWVRSGHKEIMIQLFLVTKIFVWLLDWKKKDNIYCKGKYLCKNYLQNINYSLLTMTDVHNEAYYCRGMGMQSYTLCELVDGWWSCWCHWTHSSLHPYKIKGDSQSFLIIRGHIINVHARLENTYAGFESLISGSNLGPPGMAMFSALAVKNDLWSKR